MYRPSDKYLEYIQTHSTRESRSKIVVDGVEYTGRETIKTAPAVMVDSEFYGSFPAMTCTFELFNTNRLELVGKEVEVYRGLVIDGVTEWIPLGIFIAGANDVKTSQTGNSVTYLGYNRAVKFDTAYIPLEIEYPTTIGVFAQELAFRRGVGFAETPFPCCDIILSEAPSFPAGTTEREVIRQIAELGGSNAYIDRFGNLRIAQPTESGLTLSRRVYTSLTKEVKFGGINSVIVINDAPETDETAPDETDETETDGTETETDETEGMPAPRVYTFKDEQAIIEAGGVVTAMTLQNNVFAGKDQQGFAEYIAESYIFGMEYTPFSAGGAVDDWLIDVGDIITVEDVDGTTFKTVVQSYETTARIRATIAAPVMDDIMTSYEVEGTVQKTQAYIGIQVDALMQAIQSRVSVGGVISAINQTAEQIKIDARKINLTGFVTVESLGKNGTTTIDGGRINTESLVIGGWRINDSGLYYGASASPDLYLGTVSKTVTVGGVSRNDIVFKAGDSFAVCADGCLYAAQGEFGGDLTGDTVLFNKLQARTGGKITIGDIEFTQDDGTAKIGSTTPMQVGAFSDGIANTLDVFGTSITFRVDTSDYKAVMDSDGGTYDEICFRPFENNTGNLGTANHYWNASHVYNAWVYGYLTAQNVKANSNVTAETMNAASVRASSTMVIGSATEAQPNKGLKIVNIATATNTTAYADDRVLTIGASGTLYKTGVTLAQLYTAAGASSRKYKKGIAPLGSDYDIFDKLKPMQFIFASSGEKGLGLIAEELAELAPELCFYNSEDGTVEGVKYQSIIALLIREIQRLKERIQSNG